ncbi:MAG: TrkH family potassium uptake protein [Actinobacteria bacterium]|nr:TrkH family potassium uptake protein [Actinomycetota bacterium]
MATTLASVARRPSAGRLAAPRRVVFLLSALLLVVSFTLAAPLAVSVAYGETEVVGAFSTTLFAGVALGAAGVFLLRCDLSSISRREGFVVVALGWAMICLLGAIPYVLSESLGFLNAWFESTSGFTTTGASVIGRPEDLPRGILFWRSMSQWLGGMGFVVLYVALFPLLGVGASRLYGAEVPGLEVVRLRPRISSSAGVLWLLYLLISAVLLVLLLLGDLDVFTAACEMFAVLGTGGFTVSSQGIAAHGSPYVEWVLILFMWICATSFSLHWAVLTRKPGKLLRNSEWRFFTATLVVLSLLVAFILWSSNGTPLGRALHDALFMVVSTGTTTGVAIVDYEVWAPAAQFVLFILMFMGGCAGSTAGGIKVVRIQLFLKQALMSTLHTLHPGAVTAPHLADRPVSPQTMRSVSSFLGLFMLVFLAGTVAISVITGMDILSSMSASIGMLGSNGAGLEAVGPFDTYAAMPGAGKLLLTFLMVTGRLELYTVLILFTASFWR